MTHRLRHVGVLLMVVFGQLAPSGASVFVYAMGSAALHDVLHCTCEGATHDAMCPMHRHLAGPDERRVSTGDDTCHLSAPAETLRPSFGLTAALPEEEYRPRPSAGSRLLPPSTVQRLTGSSTTDPPPPRA